MISRIQGELQSVRGGAAELCCGAIWYRLLVPACDEQRLAGMVGETVEFHTLHYLEGQGQGSSFVPRLIGFFDPDDRAFFELFTTVKGLGNRKALRALQLPIRDVASAIAARDLDLLRSLPEIGKRTAETIVAELDGKVDRFVELKPGASEGTGAASGRSGLLGEAIAVLVQLGESRSNSRRLVEQAIHDDAALDSPDAVVAAALRLRES